MTTDQPNPTTPPLRLENRRAALLLMFSAGFQLLALGVVAAFAFVVDAAGREALMPLWMLVPALPFAWYNALTTVWWVEIRHAGIRARFLLRERTYSWDEIREVRYLRVGSKTTLPSFAVRGVRFTTDRGVSVVVYLSEKDVSSMAERVSPRSLGRQGYLRSMLARHTRVELVIRAASVVGILVVLALLLVRQFL